MQMTIIIMFRYTRMEQRQTLNGGSMHHCMQLVDFMYPSPNSDWLGRGLMFGASNDNGWK